MLKKRSLFKLLVLVGLGMVVGCQSLFFHPDTTLYYHPATTARQPDNFFVPTSDNLTLHSWLFRSHVEDVHGTVVFMHGNGGNVSTESLAMLWVLDKGYNVYMVDYRGYGKSMGEPTIEGVLQDGVYALDLLMRLPNINTDELIIYGQSLGGAVATYTAVNSQYADNITALILDSTFTSFEDIAQDVSANMALTWAFQVPIASSFSDYPATIELIKNVKTDNVLVIHSKTDELIPYTHGERIYEAVEVDKHFISVDNTRHAGNLVHENVRNEILKYIEAK